MTCGARGPSGCAVASSAMHATTKRANARISGADAGFRQRFHLFGIATVPGAPSSFGFSMSQSICVSFSLPPGGPLLEADEGPRFEADEGSGIDATEGHRFEAGEGPGCDADE